MNSVLFRVLGTPADVFIEPFVRVQYVFIPKELRACAWFCCVLGEPEGIQLVLSCPSRQTDCF